MSSKHTSLKDCQKALNDDGGSFGERQNTTVFDSYQRYPRQSGISSPLWQLRLVRRRLGIPISKFKLPHVRAQFYSRGLKISTTVRSGLFV